MLTSILLDAGGVLLDEAEYERDTRDTIVSTLRSVQENYSEADYQADLDESIRSFSPLNRQYVIWKHCGNDTKLFDALWKRFKGLWSATSHPFTLMDGIIPELSSLKKRFNIILAGQYGKEIIDFLKENDALRFFMNSLSQAEFSITKPDPRYLEQICVKAGVRTDECIMVGDRIDKDVVPAKQNGMKTVFARTGVYRDQRPRTPDEAPDLVVESIEGMSAKILDRFGL